MDAGCRLGCARRFGRLRLATPTASLNTISQPWNTTAKHQQNDRIILISLFMALLRSYLVLSHWSLHRFSTYQTARSGEILSQVTVCPSNNHRTSPWECLQLTHSLQPLSKFFRRWPYPDDQFCQSLSASRDRFRVPIRLMWHVVQ